MKMVISFVLRRTSMPAKFEVVRGLWTRTCSPLLGREITKAAGMQLWQSANPVLAGPVSRSFSTFRHLEVLDKEITDLVAESEKRVVMLAAMIYAKDEVGGVALQCQVQSGFIVSGCGKILTAAHGFLDETSPGKFKLKEAWVFYVGLQKQLIRDVKVLAVDTGTDLVLLQLPALPEEQEYPHFNMSDKKLLPGQFMFTIGHPCFMLSVKRFGNLSCFERSVDEVKPATPHPEKRPSDYTLLELDFLAAKGFSGGPSLTADGTAVGVMVYFGTRDQCNVSLATPIKFGMRLMEWYESNHKEGNFDVFIHGDGTLKMEGEEDGVKKMGGPAEEEGGRDKEE